MATLIKWGTINAAGDVTTTALINQAGSQTRTTLTDLIRTIITNRLPGELDTLRAIREAVGVPNMDRTPAISEVFVAPAGATNTPTGGGFVALHARYDPDRALQLALAAGTGRMFVRHRAPEGWQGWVEVIRQPELDARISNLVDELNIAQAVKCVHSEAGAWVWDGPDAPAATHYVIPDHEGDFIVRSTPFPTPATTPELDW